MEKTINDLKEVREKLHEAKNALLDATLMTYNISGNFELSYEESVYLRNQAKSMQKLYDQLQGQHNEIVQSIKTQLSQVKPIR